MSYINTDIDNNIKKSSVVYNNPNFYETSPFMVEYYNKRMKMWHPYADIINNEQDISNNNMDVLIKAIKYVENL